MSEVSLYIEKFVEMKDESLKKGKKMENAEISTEIIKSKKIPELMRQATQLCCEINEHFFESAVYFDEYFLHAYSLFLVFDLVEKEWTNFFLFDEFCKII